MKKQRIMNLEGDTSIYFNEFPEWDEFPRRGDYHYSDSRVFEFELMDGVFDFNVKALINVEYSRWFRPEDWESPMEDEITRYSFSVQCLRGTRYHRETEGEMVLNDLELEQIENYLKDNITIE